MQRRKTLRRKTPLKSKTPLKRTARLKSVSPKPKKKRSDPRKGRGRRADALWSKVVRTRDGRCVADDGRPCAGPLQGAHIVGRKYYATRFDEDNGVALCAGHHRFYTDRPIEWDEWVVDRFGRETYDALRSKAKAGGFQSSDYPQIITRLTLRLAELT